MQVDWETLKALAQLADWISGFCFRLAWASFRRYSPPRLSVRWGYNRSVVLDQYFRGRMSQFHLQPWFIFFGYKAVR
jgi:hypothetical protein